MSINSAGAYRPVITNSVPECRREIAVNTSSIESNPVRKQYSAEQIAYLLFIAVAKSALSMDNITRLFQMQRKTYTVQQAYDYFCDSLESTLQYTFGLTDTMERFNPADMPERMMLRATIIAVTHIIYLSSQFDAMQGQGTLPANGHLALPEE